jgi:hypothetical protein
MAEIPKAVWSGEIMGLKVHVLDNGQRIVDCESFQEFLEQLADESEEGVYDDFVEEFHRFMNEDPRTSDSEGEQR